MRFYTSLHFLNKLLCSKGTKSNYRARITKKDLRITNYGEIKRTDGTLVPLVSIQCYGGDLLRRVHSGSGAAVHSNQSAS